MRNKKVWIWVLLLLTAALLLYWWWPGRYAMDADPSLTAPFEAVALETGASTVLSVPYAYDTLLVVPPYTSKERLKTLDLSWKLTRQIGINFMLNDIYHLYVIRDGELQGYAYLKGNFTTTGNGSDIVRVDAPEQLKITRQSNHHRQLIIGR